jgi:sugar lactone lactonase YvrE
MKAELLTDARCIVAESPVWCAKENSLYYVDIQGKRLRRLDFSDFGIKDIVLPQQIGCFALNDFGGYICGMEDGIYTCDISGNTKVFCKPGKMKGFRFNDGKVNPYGEFYAGTIDRNFGGALYSIETNGRIKELFDGVGNANGLDWDTNKRKFYFNDTPKKTTYVFDYDEKRIYNRKILYTHGFGNPDGMTLDEEGMLWICLWSSGCVIRLNPENNTIINKIEVPVPNAASCIFGGKDMDELIITTASHFTDLREYPLAGSVFIAKTDTKGKELKRFGI